MSGSPPGGLLRRLIPAAALVVAIAGGAAAETREPMHGRATRHDVSPPLGQMALPRAQPTGFGQEVNPIRAPHRRPGAGAAFGFEDPRLQAFSGPAPGAAPTPGPNVVFEGVSDDDNAALAGQRVVPPDAQGDVGAQYYVQWVNLVLGIFEKSTGALVSDCGAGGSDPCMFAGNTIWDGFGGVCEANNDGDPIVLYDHLAGRWFFSQFSIDEGIQCVALSQTGDPRGLYDRWEFVVSPGQENDYPKFGLMPESYFLSLRDFPVTTFPFASAVAFDRAALLAGETAPRFVKFGLSCGTDCVDGWQPPHLEGPPPPAGTPAVFTKVWDDDFDGPGTDCDGVRLWQFDVDWSVDPPTAGLTELARACGAEFDNDMCGFFNRDCIQQKDTTQRLDSVDELQMYRAQFRHSSTHDTLMVNSTVDAGADRAGIRWIELRDSGAGWAIHQEGTYAPDDGEHRWMGSIAMDGAGGIALGYSLSSAGTFPSIAYNTQAAADPDDGTLGGGEVMMHAGSGAQEGFEDENNRWGDYSTMSIDPVNDCTFWYTQQYYQATGSFDFKTRIGSFALPGCTSLGAGPSPMEFGNVVAPGSRTELLTLANLSEGGGSLTVLDMVLSDPVSFALDAGSGTCGGTAPTIASAAECTIGVTFTPMAEGVFDETLTVTSDATAIAVRDVALSGASCGTNDKVLSEAGPVTGDVLEVACLTISAGPYPIQGNVEFLAGRSIELGEDFSVAAGGSFVAGLDPRLVP